MKTLRMILFVQLLALSASASTTKVGNGDDGGDLEALTKITSEPLQKTRERALALARKLNVEGVPGLGLLVPEIERTEMFLAKADVRPSAESEGSLEVSEDNKLVYARTFAEPAAATRFFPAALALTEDQMVALHIHEALHRALPEGIREREEVVTHLTLAIASLGASHDRVRQVAGLYVQPRTMSAAAESSAPAPAEPALLPERSRVTAGFSVDSFSSSSYRLSSSIPVQQGMEFSTRIASHWMIFGYAVEPVFRARLKVLAKFSEHTDGQSSFMGPSSYELRGRARLDEDSHVGPILRFTAKSLDEPRWGGKLERDVTSLGFNYERESASSYGASSILYSLPSIGQNGETTIAYKTILSLNLASGFRWGKYKLGGLAELHTSEGSETTVEERDYWYSSDYRSGERAPFRLLVVGPEVAYVSDRFQFKAYVKRVLNEANASLDDLGDVVDRGAGRSALGTTVTMFF